MSSLEVIECSRCQQLYEPSCFYQRNDVKSRRSRVCKFCKKQQFDVRRGTPEGLAKRRDQMRHWRSTNLPKAVASARRGRMKHKYGITEHEFILAHTSRLGCCDICKVQCRGGPSHSFSVKCDLAVDHCHGSGKFRGLLCRNCNAGIGQLRDDPDRVAAALSYLKNAPLRLVKN